MILKFKEGIILFLYIYRLVHSSTPRRSSGVNIPGITDVTTFTLRLGTRQGVVSRVMRVETHRDLAFWARHLVQGAHNAAVTMKEAHFCMYIMHFNIYKTL